MPDNHPPPRLIDLRRIVIAGHRRDVATIQAASSSEDPNVRAAALGALLRIEQLSVDTLRRAYEDPSPVVVRRALELTSRHPSGPALAPDVVAFLGGESDRAELAAFVLGELGVDDSEIVFALEAQALGHAEALARESAVAALGALHAGLATILEALHDKATVRRRAVIALAPFDGPEVDAALATALEDRDWQVRQAAEDLLMEPASPLE